MEHNGMVQDLQRQLDNAQKIAEANAKRTLQDHQRQLEHVQKNSEASADRTRKRMDAEISDLQSKITKLESDLVKVARNLPPNVLDANVSY
jgi:Skp family chaperone for outer membrane proteins